MIPDPERLVAHRGWPARYPENSLMGFSAAVSAGARNIEFDIQLSRDSIPIVIHDDTTARTGGDSRPVFALPASELVTIPNGEPDRFDQRFADSQVATLEATINMLQGYDGRLFIELKRQSVARFGARHCLDAIAPLVRGLGDGAVLISFDADAVGLARGAGFEHTGWVVRRWDSATKERAASLRADYLFIASRRLSRVPEILPPPWHWVVYGIDRVAAAELMFQRGAGLVETDFIGDFLGDGADAG